MRNSYATNERRLQTQNFSQRHSLRDNVGNNSKRLLLYNTQNETTMIAALVVKYLESKDRKE